MPTGSAWRRFVYPVPNACWQLDATEYPLTGGRKCVIFQLIDDHSRYAVASHAAWGETVMDAIKVVDKAIAAHGAATVAVGQRCRAEPVPVRCVGPARRPRLPGRITPLAAWETTPKAEAPRPKDGQASWFDRPVSIQHRFPDPPPPADLPADTRVRKVSTDGTVHLDKVFYKIDVEHRFRQVLVVTDGDKLTFTDLHGEILAEHT